MLKKETLIALLENAELNKNKKNYNFNLWMGVITPLLLDLKYPALDATVSEFDSDLFSLLINIEDNRHREPLKVIFSLSDLGTLDRDLRELREVDYLILISPETNILSFYTYELEEFHLLNSFNIKTVDDNRYNKFFKFIKYDNLKNMYANHGRKLVTSSLLDKMLAKEKLEDNKYVKRAVKTVLDKNADEIYTLIAKELCHSYTFNSETEIINALKKSNGELLGVMVNLNSEGYTSLYSDEWDEDSDNTIVTTEPITEYKPEVKTEVNTVIKPEPQLETIPEPKQEVKSNNNIADFLNNSLGNTKKVEDVKPEPKTDSKQEELESETKNNTSGVISVLSGLVGNITDVVKDTDKKEEQQEVESDGLDEDDLGDINDLSDISGDSLFNTTSKEDVGTDTIQDLNVEDIYSDNTGIINTDEDDDSLDDELDDFEDADFETLLDTDEEDDLSNREIPKNSNSLADFLK